MRELLRECKRQNALASGHSAARIRTATVWDARRREWNGDHLNRPSSQVEPLLGTVAQSDEPNPVQDRVFVAANFEQTRVILPPSEVAEKVIFSSMEVRQGLKPVSIFNALRHD